MVIHAAFSPSDIDVKPFLRGIVSETELTTTGLPVQGGEKRSRPGLAGTGDRHMRIPPHEKYLNRCRPNCVCVSEPAITITLLRCSQVVNIDRTNGTSSRYSSSKVDGIDGMLARWNDNGF